MKKQFLVFVCLLLVISLAFATELRTDRALKAYSSEHNSQSLRQTREAPVYNFSVAPTNLMTSYYDYMIGGYNSQPLRVIPDNAGGGYFLTYHGQRNAIGPRRVFYAHINESGELVSLSEITTENTVEGMSSLAVDPISGKPLYAWQKNADADPQLEVLFTSDAFITGISGLFGPNQTIVDNPIAVYPPSGGSVLDNEFISPSIQIGPSPQAGMRRVYVLTRNNISHTMGPSQNVYIAYADFNSAIIEDGSPLNWSYTNIPELDAWNNDADWRNPHLALTVDNLGNLYYAGYHTSVEAATNDVIIEPDFDVFMCDNFGEGTWTRISGSSQIPSWNPPATPAGNLYFTNDFGTPYTNDQLFWALTNSSHLNAITDNYGRIIVPGIWALRSNDGGYWQEHQVVKSIIYNPSLESFSISEIYPQKNEEDDFNEAWTPWDTSAPWGVAEYFPQDEGPHHIQPETVFPFPHWDSSLHGGEMMHYYNNIKITEPNAQGMMVAVWQDSRRAKCANEDGGTDYLPYVQVPEIFISVSANQGDNWSEPIKLNSVEVPEFSSIKPMWVYPADLVKYVGMEGENKIGRLGLMFFNDYTWGANAVNPPAHTTNNGGQVMFAELEIVFPEVEYEPVDPFTLTYGEPAVLSSSMSLMAAVMIDNEAAAGGDVLAAFVTDIDTNEDQLRGIATLQHNSGITGCLMQIFTDAGNEEVHFKLWHKSSNEVLEVQETIISVPNGNIGSWPDAPFWLHAIGSLEQEIQLNAGWNMFSLNVHHHDQLIPNIFGDAYSDLDRITTPAGVHIPGNPYSTLSQLQDGVGYYARMDAAHTITVRGYPIPADSPLDLNAGWNLVSYLPQIPIPAYHAISSISDQLIQLKGEEGIYEPGNPFSSLQTMYPGNSYWMKLSSAATLIYPEGIPERDMLVDNQDLPENLILKSDSQSVLLGFAEETHAGETVTAWVGNELRGLSTIKEVNGKQGALMQIFTDTADEQVIFKLETTNQTLVLQPGLRTSPGRITGSYSNDSFFMLTESHPETPELITGLSNVYPNPFNHSTSISLEIAKDAKDLKVEIYNIRGQKVTTLLSGKQDPGTMNLVWDGMDSHGRNMPSGIYFCRLKNGNTNQSIKLMLIK
ncbi:MAG: hypothetical protein PWP64_529 [Candidatus Cloacimonadota bacterium]|nr:hypothetical protein [Candidatus Cloacimonadota bacterium]